MDSEAEFSSFFDWFTRRGRDRELSVLMPLILGAAAAAASAATPDTEDPDGGNPERRTPRERIVLIDPFSQRVAVIEGGSDLDSLLQGLGGKDGQPPASKASIDAMPSVKIVEADGGSECAICLEQFEVDGVAKEMPCKHRFHGVCIEKWLTLHGSCPVCRFTMPVEEEEVVKKSEETGGEGRRVDGEIRVRVFVHNRRRASEGPDQASDEDTMQS
ncbi:E3 ubiquitin-protein ligase MPSR1-like [Pyrus x bretschneideri]|uniref:E3 ubiquitin-protein ligase MPSR1-like n=1 Tax=Pyrus x bretschneideri TaxID=225117 RepID=UPI002030096E|nr:E3 ubiquitin-protein ligase MPSR1-like [Pyrus x bretschneideri]